MPIHNADIAAIFTEIADLLEIEGANPFRIRAYRNAARIVGEWPRELASAVARGEDLTRLPGIGEDLAAKIQEIVTTGKCRALEKLRKELPPMITELLHIPGLGPKRVRTLWHELDIQTLEQLARAAHDGRIRRLPGFGAKTEANILQAVEQHLSQSRRFKLAIAWQYAQALVNWLKGAAAVEKIEIAGSFRRARETVGDLDILVATQDVAAVMQRFIRYEEVKEVLAAGVSRGSVVLQCGLQVDLRLIEPSAWGAALLYFTGSKAHNIALRKLAQEAGLKLNEYGLFRGRQRIAGASEEEVYAALGLAWIPPELREDRGEIGAARAQRLPRLVRLSELRGDLHVHTKATDGHDSLEAMAEEAQRLGFEYLAITEHSRRLTMAHGLDARRLREQGEKIDRLNETFKGFRLLKGIEVDILEDGSLDLPDDVLGELDLVVAAIHSRFDLPRAKQTERILRALERPYLTILAHPTGRLIDARPPFDVDMVRIVRAAKARGCFLELNAHPERLDLTDSDCLLAKDEGVLVAINSDAHSRADFANLRFGVGQARRGWLEAKDVLNTRSLAELLPLLSGTKR